MKKPVLIIATVAGYSLLETALLLIFLLPEEGISYQGSRHGLLTFAQFLTIPGLAVLFSLILYGPNQWKRRMAIHFVTVPGFLMLILLMGLPAALLEWAYNKYCVYPNSFLFPITRSLYPVVILGIASVLAFHITKKERKRVVVFESSRWLAERQAGIGARERRGRERAIRWSLWIPSVVVLTVFLFLPEVWGLLTHMQRPRAGQLPGYEVTIPPTWIIISNGTNSLTGASGVSGIAGRGMGRGAQRYLHFGDPSISGWGVGIAEYDEPKRRSLSRDEAAVARRDFQIGRAKLTCLEYRPSWGRPMRTDAEPLVLIECTGSDRLHASFTGERIHAPAFYGMLASMTPALPTEAK
jgi:hypothetical protein